MLLKKYFKISLLSLAVFGFCFLLVSPALAISCTCKTSYKTTNVADAKAKPICEGKKGQYGSSVCSDCVISIDTKTQTDCTSASASGKSEAKTNVEKIIKNLFTSAGAPKVTEISCSLGTAYAGSDYDTCGNSASIGALVKCAGKTLNPANINSPAQLIGYGIKFNFFLIGGITLALYIWAGVLYMTAGGNAERRGKAMKILLWVTLGVLAMFAAFMVMQFVFNEIILKK